jgi:hypothetical protein
MVDKSIEGYCSDHGEYFGTECPSCEDDVPTTGQEIKVLVTALQEQHDETLDAILDGDWCRLFVQGQEIKEGWDYEILEHLKQIAKEEQVILD